MGGGLGKSFSRDDIFAKVSTTRIFFKVLEAESWDQNYMHYNFGSYIGQILQIDLQKMYEIIYIPFVYRYASFLHSLQHFSPDFKK